MTVASNLMSLTCNIIDYIKTDLEVLYKYSSYIAIEDYNIFKLYSFSHTGSQKVADEFRHSTCNVWKVRQNFFFCVNKKYFIK